MKHDQGSASWAACLPMPSCHAMPSMPPKPPVPPIPSMPCIPHCMNILISSMMIMVIMMTVNLTTILIVNINMQWIQNMTMYQQALLSVYHYHAGNAIRLQFECLVSSTEVCYYEFLWRLQNGLPWSYSINFLRGRQ